MAGRAELSAPDPNGSVAELRAVRHVYRKTVALADVDLAIPAGKMVGFVGPDGVGKSTLLGLVAGTRRVQQGRVAVFGADMAVDRARDEVYTRIGYMPQGLGRNLYPDLSVAETVAFFAQLFGRDGATRAQRVEPLLAGTGLAPFPDRRARQLSGGMKQKLGLCCALVHTPELLVLDEPTTGVDPLSRRQFWDLINGMRRNAHVRSVLVATAYMDEAEQFDWLCVMAAGRVLATGTPDELKRRTNTASLEDAYVALLPDGVGRPQTVVPPRVSHGDGPAIEAINLTRRFGDFTAVDDVSFTIERGEIFGFVGPNGCGKSTTMKMLAGLLPPTAGTSRIFGRSIEAGGLTMRRRIGYMSQSFSLYGELSVRQNLSLHAQLFQLDAATSKARIASLVERFELEEVLDAQAAALPLGVRQRLSLAVAVIHDPELLILDEPTSGVDPVARDRFWALLIELSREQGVTVFVSTHFMSEAARCDRIAMMNEGRVLAQGAPTALVQEQDAASLEDAFIAYLRRDGHDTTAAAPLALPTRRTAQRRSSFALFRAVALARRETMELMRDHIRLGFALVMPAFLLVIFGLGISFDVEDLAFGVLDFDRSAESRAYVEQFARSRFFDEQPPIESPAELDRRLTSGDLMLAIEIPPDFGRDIKRNAAPEVGIWIDGGESFRAETARGYVVGVHTRYLRELAARSGGVSSDAGAAIIAPRFRYNQSVESIFAMVPGTIAFMLAFVPAMLTAVGVVREKELGSISNLYVTPLTRFEFLLGKQAPYVVVSTMNFALLTALAVFAFNVPVKGSLLALSIGAVLYVIATTGYGLLISAFTRTQMAALFAALILTILPAIQFSGMITPVSSLTGGAQVMGRLFPTGYFNQISVGAFTKALAPRDFVLEYAALAAFGVGFLVVSTLLLRKQER